MQLEVRSNIEFTELSHPYKIFLCRFLFYFEEWLLTYYEKFSDRKLLGNAKRRFSQFLSWHHDICSTDEPQYLR